MENEVFEAMLVSTATGVTFIQAKSEAFLKLKVFTFMSRDFETSVNNFDLNYRDFLEKFSVLDAEKNALYVEGWHVWGNRKVHNEVLSDSEGFCRMKVNVKIPEFNILAEENEFFGEVKFKFEECKNVN